MNFITAFKFLRRNLTRLLYLHYNVILLKTVYAKSFHFNYRGIPTVKLPTDLANYQMIIHQTKPDLIIEIGTHLGGSALYLADLLEIMQIKGEVHTIDIEKRTLSDLILLNSKIKIFTEGWKFYDINNALKYKRILVIDDGSHNRLDVEEALAKFAPLVSVNSYYIVEDGITRYLGIDSELGLDGGPSAAIKNFINTNHDFAIDITFSKFWGKALTANPSGYLKKIR